MQGVVLCAYSGYPAAMTFAQKGDYQCCSVFLEDRRFRLEVSFLGTRPLEVEPACPGHCITLQLVLPGLQVVSGHPGYTPAVLSQLKQTQRDTRA